jgi:glyoxylase-like metal-dependent hydrolase (beta-lactamase superfamily II)
MKHVVCGILFAAVIFSGCVRESASPGQPLAASAEEPMIFSYKVGKMEVVTLVETRRTWTVPVINVEQEVMDVYFPDGTAQSQVNAFLVRNGRKNILIDTGFGTTLFDNLNSLGISPEAINAVLITHLHGDHFSGLAKDGVALFPKATVYLAAAERDFWTNINVNDDAVAALNAYGKRVKTFNPGELGTKIKSLLPGITPIAAFGHTPGHTIFMIESNKQRLLVLGDLKHVEQIQFDRPEVSVRFDTDPAKAAEVRRTVFDYVAAHDIPIASMHLLYPSIGKLVADGTGFVFSAAK